MVISNPEIKVTLSLGAPNFEPQAKRAEKALEGIGQAGATSARQIAAATRSLPAQFTDIATQLAGGQNPFLILLQQGGQIKDQFGGVGNAVRGIASVITPFSVALGGAAIAAGTLAYAFAAGNKQATELRDTLALTGNAAGQTADSIRDLATRVSDSTQQTVGGAREIAIALAATGQTSASVIESQAKVIGRLSDITGRAGKEIAATFADQLEAPAKFAAKLNETYNFLSIADFKRIQQLEAAGKAADAVRFTNEQLQKSLEGQRSQLGTLERGWDDLAKALGRYKQALLDLGKPETIGDVIANQARALDAANRQAGGNQRRGSLSRAGIAGLVDTEAEAERLRELRRANSTQMANLGSQSEAAARTRAKIAELQTTPKVAKLEPAVDFGVLDALDGRLRQLQRMEEGLTAIRDGVGQSRADFLRSEKAQYDENIALDERAREAQKSILQGLTDDNVRASAELIEDARERAAALIAIEQQLSERRIKLSDLTAEAQATALERVNELAALKLRAVDQGIAQREREANSQRAEGIADSISSGVLDGFRRGGGLADIFLQELKAQFAETVLTPLIRPAVEAGNGALQGVLQSILGGLTGRVSLGTASGADLSQAWDMGPAISGARASGGPVSAGRSYLVGERGPEVLRLGAQSGTIVPNQALGGRVSLAPVVTVHIDARSDAAQVSQLVAAGVQQGMRTTMEQLRLMGVTG